MKKILFLIVFALINSSLSAQEWLNITSPKGWNWIYHPKNNSHELQLDVVKLVKLDITKIPIKGVDTVDTKAFVNRIFTDASANSKLTVISEVQEFKTKDFTGHITTFKSPKSPPFTVGILKNKDMVIQFTFVGSEERQKQALEALKTLTLKTEGKTKP